jgi:hypothetical protein
MFAHLVKNLDAYIFELIQNRPITVKNFFKSFYNKIKKRLENKGIILFNIDCATNEIIKRREKTLKNRTSQLTFDGLSFPNVNTLYIHLFGNQYYSDTLYNKKKIEMEREMLFLLAGKLGVKIINYETEIVETTISRANANIKIKGMNTSTNFCKNIKISKGSRGQEEYINRGATVYLKYNTSNWNPLSRTIHPASYSTTFGSG